MANVANTKATGPVSKDVVSGGKTFTPKLSVPGSPNGLGGMANNGFEEARRKIMSLRAASSGLNSNVESVLTKKPS